MELLRARAREGDPRLELLFRQAGRALADAVAATMSVLLPHHIILAGPGMEAFEMMRPAYEERLSDAVLPWLHKRTMVLVRPSAAEMIVGGMVRRALSAADRRLIDRGPPNGGAVDASPERARAQ
jgi:predicted NBD/HSP70 family sugar kinase